MKKIVLLSALLLSGCYKLDSTINKEFEFAKNFCGGETKIKAFYAYKTMSSRVYCNDGRNTDIPSQ
ncbi:hypothetical protein KPBMHCEF_00078 [Salmonella phage EH3]|nr:hypothetical protein KPBMHCEF_00078 [Salmonella phage EH3]